ncbi:MAG: hydrogenase maturation protease [Methylocystis sp.]
MSNNDGRPRWLIFAIGNPSRGDDALGPMLVERLERWIATTPALPVNLVLLTDFQWQVEHALDLQGIDVAIFADASVSGGTSIKIAPISPKFDASYSTHTLSPACILAIAARLGQELPQAWLLSMPGEDFELGALLSAGARSALDQAYAYLCASLQRGLFAAACPASR